MFGDEVPSISKGASQGVRRVVAGDMARWSDMEILVLDSRADLLEEVAALLRRRSLRVQMAMAPEEAVALLEANADIAVLVTDLSLPAIADVRLLSRALQRRRPRVELVLVAAGRAEDPRSAALMADLGLLPQELRLHDIAFSVGRALIRAAARRGMPAAQDIPLLGPN